MMDFSNIKKMETLNSTEKVNDYLGLGWKVVNIFNTAYDTQPPGCYHQTPHYVVAWVENQEPLYPPDPWANLGHTV